MRYPVRLIREGEARIVDFVDLPYAHAVVYDDDPTSLQREGLNALETALEVLSEMDRPIPLPSADARADGWVHVPATLAAKIHLYNEWKRSGRSKRALAEAMGVHPSAVSRLFDFRYRSKMENIEAALAALNCELDVVVRPPQAAPASVAV